MKVVEDGHVYHLKHVNGDGHEVVSFIKRSGGAVTHDVEHPGTNVQEAIRMLIDRIEYLHAIIPAVENLDCIHHLRMSLLCFEGRAWRRKQAKINREQPEHDNHVPRDKDLPFDEMGYVDDLSGNRIGIEHLPVGSDGHILCDSEDRASGHYSTWSWPPDVRSELQRESK